MILIVLAVGLVFGLVQGICVGYLQIQPFIVTMAGLFFARGMVSVISTRAAGHHRGREPDLL